MKAGILPIIKPSGISSYDVIRDLKRKGVRGKLGYIGTLDPMAKGVLPVLFGKATRMADLLGDGRKKYIGRFRFGIETDSLDITGKVIRTVTDLTTPSSDAIRASLSTFRGSILQVPPKVSAKKVKGRRAYAMHRKGEDFELEPVKVTIYSINLIESFDNDIVVEIECSRGTYIRSIARDLGKIHDLPCALAGLMRTVSGQFTIEDCIPLQAIEDSEDFYNRLRSPADYLDLPEMIYYNPERIRNGVFIKDTGVFDSEKILVKDEEGDVLAVYKKEKGCFRPDIILI